MIHAVTQLLVSVWMGPVHAWDSLGVGSQFVIGLFAVIVIPSWIDLELSLSRIRRRRHNMPRQRRTPSR